MLRRSLPRFCSTVEKCNETRKTVETAVRNITNDTLRPLDHFKAFVPEYVYSTPMVVMLGNHSSGKSTLINSLLKMEEQTTGVAPVDDGFTIIMRGDHDSTEDGPTAVANQRYGLGQLKPLGSVFVNRLKVKTRRLPEDSLLPENMMIVDSPGMIDAPSGYQNNTNATEADAKFALSIPASVRHRGYDFLAATKWFAQRADVILLMFDPNNPGTTSETLSVLTQSLAGQEHKFLIVFNKIDMFDKVVDFARAYATLCWNLSKVIPLKDIPHIYTTYTPTGRNTLDTAAVPEAELNQTRKLVREEILRAPSRRLDNLLTETEEAARRVLLCGQVTNALKQTQKKFFWSRIGVLAAATVLGPSAVVGSIFVIHDLLPTLIISTISAVGIGLMWKTTNDRAASDERKALSSMDNIVRELFPGKSLSEEVRQRWVNVKPVIEEHASRENGGISELPNFSTRELKRVDDIISKILPELRTQVDDYRRMTGQIQARKITSAATTEEAENKDKK
jgi:ribosome biogenesis GTPase A